jgi:eukaryotic-like serine/threonine-protein kinase
VKDIIADKYRVLEQIGADSVTQGYRCVCLGPPNQTIIVRTLFDEVAKNEHAVQGIRRSVMRFSPPIHRSVARVIEFELSSHQVFYSTEDIIGDDLCGWLKSPRPINLILPILLQLTEALSAIHGFGFIHRNIKPETIFVSGNGTVVLRESVISVEPEVKDGRSDMYVFAETDNVPPEYMEHGSMTIKGDIHSLGVLAYELITGKSPYRGNSVFETMTKRLKEEIPLPQLLRADCPKVLAETIILATRKNPDERYQSAVEFYNALKKVTW